MLQLRDCVAQGARVSGGIGGIGTHAHDAVEALKADDLARLLKIGGKMLQHAGCHRQIANCVSVDLGVTARKTDDAGPGQLKKFGVDAAEGAPCADEGHVAVGDKLADCLRNRLVGIGGEVPLVFGKVLGEPGVLPGERSVDIEEANIAALMGCAGGRGGRGGGHKFRLEAHDLVKMLFNAGNGDADNHLGGLARNDEALGAHRDKRRVICNDGRVCDLDAQARGAVGCAHDIANAT